MWNSIVLGRGTSAALRGVLRRWWLAVEWKRRHCERLRPRGLPGTRDGLTPPVLARALQPFPVPVRTLDRLHLATIEFIRAQGETVELASYDNRLLAAARALGIALSPL